MLYFNIVHMYVFLYKEKTKIVSTGVFLDHDQILYHLQNSS